MYSFRFRTLSLACIPAAEVQPCARKGTPASHLVCAQIYSKTRLNIHPCRYDAYGMTIAEAASQGQN